MSKYLGLAYGVTGAVVAAVAITVTASTVGLGAGTPDAAANSAVTPITVPAADSATFTILDGLDPASLGDDAGWYEDEDDDDRYEHDDDDRDEHDDDDDDEHEGASLVRRDHDDD